MSFVTFVHPILSRLKFSKTFLRHLVPEPSADHNAKFYGDASRETPQSRVCGGGINTRGVAKYSDVGHVDGYISETVQDTASGAIND